MTNPTDKLIHTGFKSLKGDPILFFLNSKLKLTPFIIGIVFIVLAALMIPWAMITDVWTGTGIYKPLLTSYHTWIGDIILGVTNIFILRFYINFSKSLENLYKQQILIDGSKNLSSLSNSTFSKIYNVKKIIIVFIISITVSSLMQYLWCSDGEYGWTEIDLNGMISPLGWYHLIYFILEFFIILNFIIAVFYTIQLFRKIEKMVVTKELQYNFVRLCEHNSGGLKPLSDVAMNILKVVFTIGIYSSILAFATLKDIDNVEYAQIHHWQKTELFFIVIYVITAPTIFFMLLTPLHRMMKRKKASLYKLLQEKDKEIAVLETESIGKLIADSESYKKVKFNDELFKMVRDLPIWPFNLNSITKLISITIVPLIPILYEILLK